MRTGTAVILLLAAALTAAAAENVAASGAPSRMRVASAPVSPNTEHREPSAAALTLPEALAQALASSPRLEEARSGVALARGQKRGARAEGAPSVGLSAGESLQGPKRRSIRPGTQFDGSVDLSVPLDTNGRIKAGKRAAGHAERAALDRLDAEGQRLVLDVTEAYLVALQAR
jgi:outer membrane protein TolC